MIEIRRGSECLDGPRARKLSNDWLISLGIVGQPLRLPRLNWQARRLPYNKSSAGDRAHDEEWLFAFHDCVGQGSIGRFVRDVFPAREEADKLAAFERSVIANCAAQHRIFFFEHVENGFHCCRSINIDMHLVAHFCQRAEMMRKNDTNHIFKSEIRNSKLETNPKFEVQILQSGAPTRFGFVVFLSFEFRASSRGSLNLY
jgi:hypothetical protein